MNSKLGISGLYAVEIVRDGVVVDSFEIKNIVPVAARNYIQNCAFRANTPIASFYIGLFEGNYTPVDGDVSATFPTLATETSAYDETTRQTAVFADSTGGLVSNSASRAEFTMNASKTIYGAFLSSSSTKGSTAGLLASAAKFATPKVVTAGDIVRVSFGSTLNAA